jgi:hypothetical protein
VIDRVMLALTTQRAIAAKGIGVVDRALACVSGDMAHQFLDADVLDHFGVDLPIALQQAENNAFPPAPRPRLPLR